MKREIKFRVWHKPEKKMYFYLKVKFGKATNITLEGKFKDVDRITTKTVPNDDLEIMQFTGLLDNNGKEIYEGDVVRELSIDRTFIVVWTPDDARFDLVFQSGENCYFGQKRHFRDVQFMEVIGNIYETPTC